MKVFDQLAAGSVVALPDDLYQGVAGLAAAGEERRRWSVQCIAVDDTAGWIRACGAVQVRAATHVISLVNSESLAVSVRTFSPVLGNASP